MELTRTVLSIVLKSYRKVNQNSDAEIQEAAFFVLILLQISQHTRYFEPNLGYFVSSKEVQAGIGVSPLKSSV